MATKKATTKTPEVQEGTSSFSPTLDTYLSYVREGDASGTTDERFWIASLTQGGHTTDVYAKSQQEVEQRAREILAARGIEV
jgi:hypothetical protein